jgi:hypothetical protein
MHITSIGRSASSARSGLVLLLALGAVAALFAAACESETPGNVDPNRSSGDGGFVDGSEPEGQTRVDGGFAGPDGSVLRADRFVTKVVSFTPGDCAGFGGAELPDIVYGPPVGGGNLKGSLDTVSLGIGGEIVLSFEPNAIVDGPGPDFIVFENAFYASGNDTAPYADLGEVSVSEDGVTWKEYPCTPGSAAPYGACAGWHPVQSAPSSGISPFEPSTAGGEAYDLHELGLTTARFVRIRDKSTATCGEAPKPNNSGFDLDAIAIINAATP